MHNKRMFGALVALCLCSPAQAGELLIHTVSTHFGEKGYNEHNPGVGYITDDGLAWGMYRNSLGRNSVYAGYSYAVADYKHASVKIMGGALSGYSPDIIPFIVPELRVKLGGYALAFHYVPSVEFQGAKTTAALGLTIVIPLKGE